MKSKIVILCICVLMSACGKGGRGQKTTSSSNSPTAGLIDLMSLRPQPHLQLRQAKSGAAYYHIGIVSESGLPAALKSLPSETPVGTLKLEMEEEVYKPFYGAGEAISSVFKKRQREVKTTVYLVKDESMPGEVIFALKDLESAKLLQINEEPINIESDPKPYCMRAHFFFKQVRDGISVRDQQAMCAPNGVCTIIYHADRANTDASGTYDTNARPVVVANDCIEYGSYYAGRETQVNRYTPKAAIIGLFPQLTSVETLVRISL